MKKVTLVNESKLTTYQELANSRKELINENTGQFGNIEHQLEFVCVVNGVTYVNDSRSSDVNSTWYALNKIKSNIIWIAGGVEKNNDYEMLLDIVKDKVKAIICIGENNEGLVNTFHLHVPMIVVKADNMDEAIKFTKSLSQTTDTVLLSPACASYDRFKDYKDRGDKFKEAVEQIKWKSL